MLTANSDSVSFLITELLFCNACDMYLLCMLWLLGEVSCLLATVLVMTNLTITTALGCFGLADCFMFLSVWFPALITQSSGTGRLRAL